MKLIISLTTSIFGLASCRREALAALHVRRTCNIEAHLGNIIISVVCFWALPRNLPRF